MKQKIYKLNKLNNSNPIQTPNFYHIAHLMLTNKMIKINVIGKYF